MKIYMVFQISLLNTIYNSSISSFTGNVIIKFSAYSSSSGTVTFNITGETIQNYHTVKNSTCQTTVSGGSNALTTTSVSSGTIYSASIPSGVDKYFSFNSSSSKIYSVIWSGKNILWYDIYKGVGNSNTSTSVDDYNSSISSFTGNVIIKFSAYSSSSGSVDFMVYEK